MVVTEWQNGKIFELLNLLRYIIKRFSFNYFAYEFYERYDHYVASFLFDLSNAIQPFY